MFTNPAIARTRSGGAHEGRRGARGRLRPAERTGVSMTATSWQAATELPLSQWSAAGRRLGAIGRGVGWWIGDWLNYGNRRFGERYTRAKRITRYDVQTLMNMVYVASRFPPERRREGLSFSHHAELAALAPDEQDRWLTRAEAKGWSVRCLREELRGKRGGRGPGAGGGKRPTGSPEPADEALVCPRCGEQLRAATGDVAR